MLSLLHHSKKQFTLTFVSLFSLFSFFALWAQAQAPAITVTRITPNRICSGSDTNIVVNYRLRGTFPPGSTFTAQLSDITGSFSNPTNIGTSAPDSLFLTATIPSNLPAGTGYLIRVISNNRPDASFSTAGFTIKPLPQAFTITGGGNYCSGVNVTLGLSGSQLGVEYQLFRNNGVPLGTRKQGTGSAISLDTII